MIKRWPWLSVLHSMVTFNARKQGRFMDKCTIKFSFSAGPFIRNQARLAIENAAFVAGVECQFYEERSFFDSNYRVLLKGDKNKVDKLYKKIETYFKDNC